jgi:hypothetical protein
MVGAKRLECTGGRESLNGLSNRSFVLVCGVSVVGEGVMRPPVAVTGESRDFRVWAPLQRSFARDGEGWFGKPTWRRLRSTIMALLIALLASLHWLCSASRASAANLIFEANDAAIARMARGRSPRVGTGVQSVYAAARAVPRGGVSALILAGHGASGVIGLGSGTQAGYHEGLDLMYDELRDVALSLRSMNRRLNPTIRINAAIPGAAIVVLSSCCTGADPHGRELVEQLSEYLRNAVVFANINSVGLTRDLPGGTVCTAEGNRVWQMGSTIAAYRGERVAVGREEMRALTTLGRRIPQSALCAP